MREDLAFAWRHERGRSIPAQVNPQLEANRLRQSAAFRSAEGRAPAERGGDYRLSVVFSDGESGTIFRLCVPRLSWVAADFFPLAAIGLGLVAACGVAELA